MKKSKTTTTSQEPVTSTVLYSIIKLNMQFYRLVKITLNSDGTSEIKKLHEDIPSICYGKLLATIQAQGFTPNA